MTAEGDIFLALRERLEQVRSMDRHRFAQELQRLESQHRKAHDVRAALSALQQRMANSAAQVESLRQAQLRLDYDAALPITAHREEILAALEKHPVIVVCGATGSGKTTQLPKFCLEAGRGAFGMIGHTQPRRIAARAIAGRLAEELGSSVGGAVGYQVRFTDRSGPQCRVKVMTDGILLRELEGDPYLRRYDTLIIDEAHERSLNIDLLLGVLQRLVAKRADLKLIITSATIDPDKFARFFNGAPVIEVSGRSYPVEVRYRPLNGEDEDSVELSLPQGIVSAVQELERETQGDILVFLPGEKQIREADKALRDARLRSTEILPLFARLSTREQERIFAAHSGRRVVLSTNVAETSLTVPGVRHVVDSGLARISRYSVRGKVQRLPIEPISQASAEQRKGRCGRVAEGICIRLYGEADFEVREAFTSPEILRTNLASVILKLATMGFGDPTEFPFIDPPDLRAVNDGYRLLQELKAVDEQRRITSLGKQIASLPVDPRLARMLLAADHHRCLAEMLILTAFLSIQDPRERPAEAQQQADQHHASSADARSDFMTLLTLWKRFQEQAEALSGNQLRKWCREQFLSFMRMREWQEVHAQLNDACKELDLRPNQIAANYAELHQALLTGFLGQIGELEENREYLGARGARFVIAPGTPLASKPPKWLVAGSLVETTRVYARMVAAVEPGWIEAAAAHLLKRSYSEPHWQAQRGFVAAFETVALYGLTLSARRRVNYASIAPKEAREIFLRAALVEGQAEIKARFLEHNRRLQAEVEKIEAKIRRRDLLVDEQAQVDFYLRHLPESVHSTTALNRHLQQVAEQVLFMSRDDLMRRGIADVELLGFPDTLAVAGNDLSLTYKFEPSAEDDGVTLTVPEPLLASLNPVVLAACIPGMLLEKITEILRALPKALRKLFVPVPAHAAEALQTYASSQDLYAHLAEWISRRGGASVAPEELMALSIPRHLHVNIRVVDLDGRRLNEGRDLKLLRRDLRQHVPVPSNLPTSNELARTWNFGELPVQREAEQGGVRFSVYPAIEDRRNGVAIVAARSLQQAEQISTAGLVRLFVLNLPQQYKFVRNKFAQHRELLLLGQDATGAQALPDALAERAFRDCFISDEADLPRTAAAFERKLNAGRSNLEAVSENLLARVLPILQERRAIRQRLNALTTPAPGNTVKELQAQLDSLVPTDFLVSIPNPWLGHLVRYLKAVSRRLERLPANAARDAMLAKQVQPFAQALDTLRAEQKGASPEAVIKLRWMIEEYRVSLFAQDLRTAMPVSDKRLNEQLALARKAIAGG